MAANIEELVKVAAALTAPGKGLLAADESTVRTMRLIAV